ncbi:sensor domain-containing protein [Kitasatospora sp. NPDC050543]|uniref:sensor domain-containing protein n=1 Tax=Kitasatospora sp. NPDC050543 TaxID=3364054 RepID=UPI0037BCC3FC
MSSSAQQSEYGSYDDDHYDARRPAATLHRPGRPGLWRAPFAAETFGEIRFALTGLPVATAGFVFAVTLFSFGLSTVVTVIGLPVLAVLLSGARAFAALERARARTMLGLDVPGPAPVRSARPGFWGGVVDRLSDAAGWKAVLYQVITFPWAVLSFVVTLDFLLLGWAIAAYPLYHWAYARFTPWAGLNLFDYTDSAGGHHEYVITSPLQIAGVSAFGFLLVFLTPLLVRGLNGVNRCAIRGLLSR